VERNATTAITRFLSNLRSSDLGSSYGGDKDPPNDIELHDKSSLSGTWPARLCRVGTAHQPSKFVPLAGRDLHEIERISGSLRPLPAEGLP
jgi:hypothetical protein